MSEEIFTTRDSRFVRDGGVPSVCNPLKRRDFLVAAAAAYALSAVKPAAAHIELPSWFTTALEKRRSMAQRQEEEKLDFLKNYPTSLLESALALLRGTHDGIRTTSTGLKLRFPKIGRLAGYAVTSVFSTDPEDERGHRETLDYWKYAFEVPGPKIAVSL